MFSIHDFVLKTVVGMIHRYPDFQVREYALNWYGKGVLTEADLAYIEELLTAVPEPEPEPNAEPEEEEPEQTGLSEN